ncbi:hypothetical protein T11_737 [Trichinella zimbabwensis]|uniref:Uncharacterized protein n=1 Tax=Trichinella zimbabwensis TaxID=268475 RepID=A0A0V1HLX7_9BILA|nr:hypothetical protein T11_737 [Trichinella zimbabwensis]
MNRTVLGCLPSVKNTQEEASTFNEVDYGWRIQTTGNLQLYHSDSIILLAIPNVAKTLFMSFIMNHLILFLSKGNKNKICGCNSPFWLMTPVIFKSKRKKNRKCRADHEPPHRNTQLRLQAHFDLMISGGVR